MWPGPSDLLLMNRLWKMWWYVTSKFSLQQDGGLGALFLLLSCLFILMEASCHVMCCPRRGPCGRNWGCPPANSQQRTEVLCPTALEELDPANSHVNDLEVDHSSNELWMRHKCSWHPDCSTVGDFEPDAPRYFIFWFLIHRNPQIMFIVLNC